MAEEIARECKCQNLTPSVWQQLVETYNALGKAEHGICKFAF